MKTTGGKGSKQILAAAALAAIGMTGVTARAANYVGLNGSNWSVASNWSNPGGPSGVPSGPGASANVTISSASDFIVFQNYAYAAATRLDSVQIDSTTDNNIAVAGAANLFAINESIGVSGYATYVHQTTTNSTSTLALGTGASGIGKYDFNPTAFSTWARTSTSVCWGPASSTKAAERTPASTRTSVPPGTACISTPVAAIRSARPRRRDC